MRNDELIAAIEEKLIEKKETPINTDSQKVFQTIPSK